MYDRLDADNDGSIDIRDLTQALSLQAHIPASVAPVSISIFLFSARMFYYC